MDYKSSGRWGRRSSLGSLCSFGSKRSRLKWTRSFLRVRVELTMGSGQISIFMTPWAEGARGIATSRKRSEIRTRNTRSTTRRRGDSKSSRDERRGRRLEAAFKMNSLTDCHQFDGCLVEVDIIRIFDFTLEFGLI